jgi:hypothetical protein
MKRKFIKYSIEEPCHEDWNQMKPEAKGRFCESCCKTVVDFSQMSDFSIVSYLEGKKNEAVCGRFRPSQMDKTYSFAKPHLAFQFDLKAVALGLALTTFSAIHLNAQVTSPIEHIDTLYVKNEPLDGMVSMMEYYDHSDEKFVGGKISVSGNRFEQITIQLMNTESREISKVSLSKNGTFKIPLDWSKNPYSIVVSGPGFLSEERYFFKQESITNFKITLSEIMIKGNIKSHDR